MDFDRKQYTDSLRRLADWLDANENVPMPSVSYSTNTITAWADTADDLRAAIRGTGHWRKDFFGDLLAMRQSFGLIEFRILVMRDQVCRKRVIGTKVVPAQPEQVVEEVEWECEPILAEVGRD